jgi:predicted ATPase
MRLHRISIKNLRSVEDVTLDGLGQFNVLLGHNNAGKSTIMEALAAVATALTGRSFPTRVGEQSWRSAVTNRDISRKVGIELTGAPHPDEREQFIGGLGDTLTQSRANELRKCPFASEVSISLVLDPSQDMPLFSLKEARIRGESLENDQWPLVAAPVPNAGDPSNYVHLQHFSYSLREEPDRRIDSSWFGMQRNGVGGIGTQLDPAVLAKYDQNDASGAWPILLLRRYFEGSYFFDSFRRSAKVLEVRPEDRLTVDGANLAQVLNTARTNDEDRFEWIQAFVDGALPDIGRLKAPTIRNQPYTMTTVELQPPSDGNSVPLHSMGSGVEQLLFAAAVLSEPWLKGLVALEEPESHLHPSAQRSLIEQLHLSQAQVLVSTHSPIFVDQSQQKSVFRVALANGKTITEFAGEPGQLGTALASIGVRNSDVLLADAVLFVEDDRDYEVLTTWASVVGTPLRQPGFAVIPTRGAAYAGRNAPMRSQVLAGISRETKIIPHLFVIDHDERNDLEITTLREKIGDAHLHVLQRRELENYLLVPKAIRAAMREKYKDSPAHLERIDLVPLDELRSRILDAGAGLKGLVLLKRIRGRLGSPKDGSLTRKDAEDLSKRAEDLALPELLLERIDQRMRAFIDAQDINTIVEEERAQLVEDWTGAGAALRLAPGDEILRAVCSSFGPGIGFSKGDDTLRVAKHMGQDDVSSEIKGLLRRIAALSEVASDGPHTTSP